MNVNLRRRGVTLLELVVGFALFSVVGLLLVGAFVYSTKAWRGLSGSSTAQAALRKGQTVLQRDLRRTSFGSVRVTPSTASFGVKDGDAVWFLSAIDPATGEFMRKTDGTPFWQRTILYYLTVPNNHNSVFGIACSGGADAQGYEVQCPHKVLIRKVIDAGSPTDPLDESTEEQVMTAADIAPYLTRPNGTDVSGMTAETGLSSVNIPASGLLSFRVQLAPDPQYDNEVRMRLLACATEAARREVAVGSVPLIGNRFTLDYSLSVFPTNP